MLWERKNIEFDFFFVLKLLLMFLELLEILTSIVFVSVICFVSWYYFDNQIDCVIERHLAGL